MSHPGLSWVSVGFRRGEPCRENTQSVELKILMFPSVSERGGGELCFILVEGN